MPFDVKEYREFVELLYRHPEWRAEVRQLVLSEEILTLPQLVRELAEAQKRTEQRVEELAEAQKRTEQRVEELAEAQKRTEQRVEELAEAQKRTDEQLRLLGQRVDALAEAQKRTEQRVEELAEAQKRSEERLTRVEQRLDKVEQRLDRVEDAVEKTRSEVARLGAVIGATLEEEAGSVAETVMRQKGYQVLQEAGSLRFDGDVDVAFPVEDKQGRRLWVLVESKARLSRGDVHAWASRLRSEGYRAHLAKAGVKPPYLVYMYGIRVDVGAREALAQAGIGLMKSEGEVFPPQCEID